MADKLEARLRAGLAPDYELVRLIGRGSHAFVYLARQLGLRRLVAIKVLRPEVNRDPVLRRRFEREAVSAAMLDHPNVTPVHDVGQIDDDLPYIVMKYIEGRTLADAIAANGALPLDRARRVLAGLASALAAAHAARIVHRDVRPANVFLERKSGNAFLADFGIAGLLEAGEDSITQLTDSGIRLSDVRYISPEQIDGANATEQGDIYSLGILAYEVLTGNGPYDTGSPRHIVAAHLEGKPKPLGRLVPDIEPPFARLIQRCLDKTPNHRPTAADLAARLQGDRVEQMLPEVGPGGALVHFARELMRRKVVTVTLLYISGATVSVLNVDQLVEALNYDWPHAPRIVAVAAAAGFPLVLALSWIYDITEGRIIRTASSTSGLQRLPVTALIAASVLSLVLGWLAFEYLP